jgi:prophage tail gpP-like protein
MSASLPTAPRTTRRITLTVGGLVLSRWVSTQVCRNLRDIAGSFTFQYRDSGREALAFAPDLDPIPRFPSVLAGQPCSVAIDGTTVLMGSIDEVDVNWEADQLSCTITGRDKTGDLVDCAAAPNGPVEWRNVTALQIAQIIAKPFGIAARTDVTIDGVFPLFGVDADEIALSAIEKAARQGALLVMSDGVGGLLLTRGGSTRAPAPLTRPGNIQGGGRRSNWAQRFSDYYVKGQTNRSVIRATQEPLIMSGTDPRSGLTFPIETSTTATTTENVASVMTGHSIDPEVTRYRPTVRMVKTQAGAATVQQQAEWSLRIAKGQAETLNYKVLDWRAGPSNALWLPNALSHVTDPYAQVDKDMLISGVTYMFDQSGEYTQLELAGRTAFDRIDEPADNPRYIQSRKPKSFGPTRNG